MQVIWQTHRKDTHFDRHPCQKWAGIKAASEGKERQQCKGICWTSAVMFSCPLWKEVLESAWWLVERRKQLRNPTLLLLRKMPHHAFTVESCVASLAELRHWIRCEGSCEKCAYALCAGTLAQDKHFICLCYAWLLCDCSLWNCIILAVFCRNLTACSIIAICWQSSLHFGWIHLCLCWCFWLVWLIITGVSTIPMWCLIHPQAGVEWDTRHFSVFWVQNNLFCLKIINVCWKMLQILFVIYVQLK